ncbi:hypothetical protein ACN47E_000640 [Coniothyrium glycines]
MAETMQAWQYSSTSGGLEKNLHLNRSAARPTISANDILIRVHAMALNPVDHKVTEGPLPLRLVGTPITPGADFCGTVAALGAHVTDLAVGAWVYGAKVGALNNGSLAQYVAVKRDMLGRLPDGVRAEDAAGVGIVGLTEYQALAPNVKAGDRVFINGGSGGTGVHGIQIAKALGCHVTTSCSTGNVELCKSLGADEVIDYKSQDVVQALREKGQVFSAVVDNVGSPSNLYKASKAFLKPDAKFVQIGMGLSLGAVAQVSGNMLLPGFLGGGKNSYQMLMAKPSAEVFEQFGKWMQEGKLKGVVDTVFEWEDAPKAFEKLKTGRARGKIVVKVPQDVTEQT